MGSKESKDLLPLTNMNNWFGMTFANSSKTSTIQLPLETYLGLEQPDEIYFTLQLVSMRNVQC